MFDRILLAVDGSAHAKKATRVASDLAKNAGSQVLVVHVWELAGGRGGIVSMEAPDEATELVNEVTQELEQDGVKARGKVRLAPTGRTAKDILDEAKSYDASLIVMGTRGLTDFAGLLLGSVAHKVIHHAECPVLVVR